MDKQVIEKSLVLYDGNCGFCNTSIDFIMRRNGRDLLVFFPLQSEKSKTLLKSFGLQENFSKSIVLIEKDGIYVKSSAVLRIARKMNPMFNWFYAFIIVPKFIRDPVYDWIARHRNRWTEKNNSCPVQH